MSWNEVLDEGGWELRCDAGYLGMEGKLVGVRDKRASCVPRVWALDMLGCVGTLRVTERAHVNM